jgi:hypothetical protein
MARYKLVSGLILVFLLFLGGCYDSPFPLGAAEQSHVDDRLVNGWLEQPTKAADKPYHVIFHKFNDREYLVGFDNENGRESVLARAFVTTIDGLTVLNLQGIDTLEAKDRTFLFFKYEFTPDGNLRVWIFDGESPLLKDKTFADQAEFTTYITKNINDVTLYGAVREFRPVDDIRLVLTP